VFSEALSFCLSPTPTKRGFAHRADEIPVGVKPSMLLQWQDGMGTRFGLTFEILDRDDAARVRRDRGHSVNPMDYEPAPACVATGGLSTRHTRVARWIIWAT
jgi:hypothetical protein